MAPALLLALALFAADPDEPVATATPSPQATVTPSQAEPATEYELVAWCYGALGAHMGLYEVAMPEVERIERQFERTPGSSDADIASYATQREEGKKQLALFRNAMENAEKASIKPIQEIGVAAIRQGESTWTGAKFADPKFLAREWMSWGLPDRCTKTAEDLAAKSALLGQAISYNAQPEAPAAEPPPEAAVEAAPEAEAASAPEVEAAPAPEAEAAPTEDAPADEPLEALDAIIADQTDGDDGP